MFSVGLHSLGEVWMVLGTVVVARDGVVAVSIWVHTKGFIQLSEEFCTNLKAMVRGRLKSGLPFPSHPLASYTHPTYSQEQSP